jgi:glycyl-tRNA synthetase
MNSSDLMEKIIALCKRRGFVFPGSEIYGGLASTYDYGPAGTELLRNIRNLWWDFFVHKRDDIVGLDASVISHQEIWKASGHTSGFADAMVDCKTCKFRMRADHLIEDATKQKVEGKSLEELDKIIQGNIKIVCSNCGKHNWTSARKFNLLFPVNLGIIEGDQSLAYLRGETAQGMFVNFKNVVDSSRVRLPFGIAQLGKSFRNEITPGNSVFRTLEFEQGEIEYFFDPDAQKWEELFGTWKKLMWEFITKKLGIKTTNLRWREHGDEERSFYSKKTEDLEYNFPFGFKELWGIAYRTDYDLQQHAKFSKKDLSIIDPVTNKKIVPHVIEPAVGINRMLLMILSDSYIEEEGRIVLKLAPRLAPYKAAVFPLLANKPELVSKAKEIYEELRKNFVTVFDGRGNIGKRYFAQDEIGTPFCITVDFQSLEDDTVTIRDRDTMKQERVKTKDLLVHINKKLV